MVNQHRGTICLYIHCYKLSSFSIKLTDHTFFVSGAFDLELRQFRPHHVILMEPDIARIRAIEVYTAELSARGFFRLHHPLEDYSYPDESEVQVKAETFDDGQECVMLPSPESKFAKFEIPDDERERIPFLFGPEIHVRIHRLSSVFDFILVDRLQ